MALRRCSEPAGQSCDNDITFAPTVGADISHTDYSKVYWNCVHFRQCHWRDVRLHHSSLNK
jgi:hypothetical protein